MAGLVAHPAAAATIDIYDGLGGQDFQPLDAFFTGLGYTVNPLTSSFTSLSGADFVILSVPTFMLSSAQLTAINSYVNGGGRLLLNSEFGSYLPPAIAEVNTILASLGSTIVNQSTSSQIDFHDTSDIVSNTFTTGVNVVNYADTSSLTGGTALVFGDPATDNGQEFVAYQAIGAGYVFVIADSDTAIGINSTADNQNGVLYCNFGGLSCAASSAPEPASVLLIGVGLLGVAARRRFARASHG
jgi:hypothetical protein